MNSRELLTSFLHDIVGKLRKRFFVLVILSAFVAVTDGARLVFAFLLLPFIGIPLEGQEQGLIDVVLPVFEAFGVPYTLGPVTFIVVTVFLMQAALSMLQSWYQGSYSHYYTMLWRQHLFMAIGRARWRYFVNANRGELINILSQETTRLSDATRKLLVFFSNFLVALAYVSLAFIISPQATLLMLGAGLSILIFNIFVVKHLIRHARTIIKGNIKMMEVTQEFLSNIKTLKASPKSFAVDRLVTQPLLAIFRSERIGFTLPHASRIAAELLIMLTLVISVAITATLEVDIAAANIFMILALLMRTYTKITTCMTLAQQMYVQLPSFESVSNVYREASAQEEPRWDNGDVLTPDNLDQGICFESVSVMHDEKPALFEVDATLQPNSITAIVGASGAGKTTFVDTLLRLVDIDNGKLKVTGRDASEFNIQSWRACFGYVSQELTLINGSLAENIKLFKPEATEEEVCRAARLADAQEFIDELPNGYDTQIGEMGLRLSGGQRQRIAMARALINDPPVMIFDEATSALDSEAEEKVMKAIHGMRQTKTIVIIAHRLSTIRHADTILVLDKGRLVEHGSWEALIRNEGRFFKLWERFSRVSTETDVTQEAKND